MKIKPLDFVMSLETVVCVYRNFRRYKNLTKFFIVVWIFIEILLGIFNVGVRQYFTVYDEKVELLYFYLSTVNSAIFLPLVCLNSGTFQKLTRSMELQYKYFDHNKEYVEQLDRKQKFFTCVIIVFCILKLCFFIYYWMQYDLDIPRIDAALFYMLQLNIFMCDIRFIFEFVVIYCILCVLAQQLTRITQSIDQEILEAERANYHSNTVRNAENTNYRMNLLDKWAYAYKNVRNSSNIFNSVFSLQLSVMFLTIFFYYIILLYLITVSISGFGTSSKKFVYGCTLLICLTVLYMLSVAAQQAKNNYFTLKRRLCSLLLHCMSVPEYRDATRNLLRVVATRPIHTESYCVVTVDMSLLPRFIALCTSYTIVALQFNKVI